MSGDRPRGSGKANRAERSAAQAQSRFASVAKAIACKRKAGAHAYAQHILSSLNRLCLYFT